MIIYNILRHEIDHHLVSRITGVHSSYYSLKDAERIIKRIASQIGSVYDADNWEVSNGLGVLFSIDESCLHEPKDVPFIVI